MHPKWKKAFIKVKTNLNQIKLFHTDSGNEFKNKVIDEILNIFEIDRSLSMQECPYDNTIAEATYKVIKTEFVNNQIFETHEQLWYEFADYVSGSPIIYKVNVSITSTEWD